jgi:predicted CXXCH cytochrome family protein
VSAAVHAVVVLALAASLSAAADDIGASTRIIGPATVVMSLPDSFGAQQRPAVEFNHAAHTTALQAEGCTACHEVGDKGLQPVLQATAGLTERNARIDAVHGACVSCHKERSATGTKSGPITCGECHVRRRPGRSTRAAMAFDYSLHGRHALAYPEQCDACHHVFDEAIGKLKYEKGTEDRCRSCHGDVDEAKKLSLANASHRACISCHLERAGNQLSAGPVLCVGCHDHASQLALRRLEEIPRLVRGQPDTSWVTADGARSGMVAFSHLVHEPATDSCSGCHHRTLRPCDECHTLTGHSDGAGVTVAQSYHDRDSEHSCVGCHARRADHTDCAGCHHTLASVPGPRACVICHSGPAPGADTVVDPPTITEVVLAALPETGDAYPETVVIDGLADAYEASRLPHAKIVSRLDSIVRESPLAQRFHGDTETLCAGCHHHSPVGTRPPPCRSCHDVSAHPTRDMPGLKAAYHRQCVGCHQEMAIDKQGCTDCHAREVES